MMFGDSRQNGFWIAPASRWRMMLTDGLYVAAGRLRVRLFAGR